MSPIAFRPGGLPYTTNLQFFYVVFNIRFMCLLNGLTHALRFNLFSMAFVNGIAPLSGTITFIRDNTFIAVLAYRETRSYYPVVTRPPPLLSVSFCTFTFIAKIIQPGISSDLEFTHNAIDGF